MKISARLVLLFKSILLQQKEKACRLIHKINAEVEKLSRECFDLYCNKYRSIFGWDLSVQPWQQVRLKFLLLQFAEYIDLALPILMQDSKDVFQSYFFVEQLTWLPPALWTKWNLLIEEWPILKCGRQVRESSKKGSSRGEQWYSLQPAGVLRLSLLWIHLKFYVKKNPNSQPKSILWLSTSSVI